MTYECFVERYVEQIRRDEDSVWVDFFAHGFREDLKEHPEFLDFRNPPRFPDKRQLGKRIAGDYGSVEDWTVQLDMAAGSPSKALENSDVTDSPRHEKANISAMGIGLGGMKKVVRGEDYDLGWSHIKIDNDGKLYSVGTSNQLQVPYHGTQDNKSTSKLPKDFIDFRIRDLVNGKWIIFPAHLGTITDTVTPTYSQERYIGRPDAVHIYTGTDRSVGFDFKVAAFTKQEIPIIQEKMNYLVGLGYPSYKALFDGDSESRPVAPYISLTIGDLFKDTPGAKPYFETPFHSMYTMFKVFTVEGWYEIPDMLSQGEESLWKIFLIRFYFVISVGTGGLLGLSLANAIFVDEMTLDNNMKLEGLIEELTSEVRDLKDKLNNPD